MKRLASRGFGFVVALGVLVALVGGLVSSSGVSAQAPTVSVGSLSTSVGLEGTVDLEALDVGPPGLGAWTIDITYDPTVAAVADCTAEHGGICNPAYAEDKVRVVGTDVFGLEGDLVLATMAFACKSVGASELALTLSVLADATLGDPQTIDAAVANGSVTCTDEVKATPTPKPTETPAKLAGDADCDGTISAVDATLVLQFEAFLIDSVPCPDAADVNGDGAIDAIDAVLILQRSAGLLG